MIRRLVPMLLLMPVAACAQSTASWPSLAIRAEELTAASIATTTADPAPPAPAAGVFEADIGSRLATIDRDLAALDQRWRSQAATTQTAVAAARGAKADSAPWAAAQLELTRLGQLGNQIDDLRDRLDRAAGDAALVAHGGADMTATLARTGDLLGRVATLQTAHRAAFDSANEALPH